MVTLKLCDLSIFAFSADRSQQLLLKEQTNRMVGHCLASALNSFLKNCCRQILFPEFLNMALNSFGDGNLLFLLIKIFQTPPVYAAPVLHSLSLSFILISMSYGLSTKIISDAFGCHAITSENSLFA